MMPRTALAQTPVFYTEDQGFFREAGIVSETQIISNGSAIAAAVASGAVGVGCWLPVTTRPCSA